MFSDKAKTILSRRSVLTLVGSATAALVVSLRSQTTLAQGTASGGSSQLPHLDTTDPTAKALGYTEDASKVDPAKFPTYKAGSHCAACNFYKGTSGQQYGPCQIFAGKAVNANGWCASYAPKT